VDSSSFDFRPITDETASLSSLLETSEEFREINHKSVRTDNSVQEGVSVMVFNATLYNISAISWWSDLLVEEIRVSIENHRHGASH
jgi:hypothetical protein